VTPLARWAVVGFAAVVALLLALALAPQEAVVEVGDEVRLSGVTVALYPAADPDARWRFEAPDVTYDPGSRETTLRRIEDGARRVGSRTDFTLTSDEMTIQRDDDLRGERMDVHLIEDDLDVAMRGADRRQVVVDHAEGVFEVPRIRIFGEDFGESRYEEMRVTFDFTSFEAGGPDTIGYSELELEERSPASGGSP